MRFRKERRTLGETVGTSLMIGSAALAAFDVVRRIYRRTQLFCPDEKPVKSWNPVDYGVPEGATEEHWIETPDGEEIYAWYCRSEKPVASAIFCHGNTGNLTISAEAIPHLLAAGLNVLFFDYRGFGRSSGSATWRGVISDGVTAAKFHDKIRPKHIPSVLYGFSLGGAVAAQVIRRHPFDALILQSTFTSLPDITRVLFPRLPLHLLSGNLFDTVSVMKRLQVPLLVIHGTADETCPCSMGHKILDACGSEQKTIVTIEGGLHKDLFQRDPDTIVWAVSQFIAGLPKTTRVTSVEETPLLEEVTDSVLRSVRGCLRRKPSHPA